MMERKMIEIHQEISSHLKDPAIVQLLKREAPGLLEYMCLWESDLGDLILASRRILFFKKILTRAVKAFGFGEQVPRDIVLALVIRSCGSTPETRIDAHPSELFSNRLKRFEMRRPELRKQEMEKQFRQPFRRPSPGPA